MFTLSDIKSILFGDPRYLVRISELVEYLRTILGDSEIRVSRAQSDLEMQKKCVVRIRQLLKIAVRRQEGSSYSDFLRQCLRDTRDTVIQIENLLSSLRRAHRYLRDTNGEILNPIGGLIHIGGNIDRRVNINVGTVSVGRGVARGGGHRGFHRGGACGSGPARTHVRSSYRRGANGHGAGSMGESSGSGSCRKSRSVSPPKMMRRRSRSSSNSRSKSPPYNPPSPSLSKSRSRSRSISRSRSKSRSKSRSRSRRSDDERGEKSKNS